MTGSELSRRQLLLGSASVSAVAIAGCTGTLTADNETDQSGANGNDEPKQNDDDDTTDDDGEEIETPEELPTDPEDDDFVDMTGEDVVEIETREGTDGGPSFRFDPPFVRVDQETTIRWVNTDGVFHTVTSTSTLDRRTGGGDVFDATLSSEGDTFEWIAEDSGRQDFYCSPHAGFMFGSIEIE